MRTANLVWALRRVAGHVCGRIDARCGMDLARNEATAVALDRLNRRQPGYWGSYKQVVPPAIYGIVDSITMVSLHPGYHTLDDEQAIDRLYELHGAVLKRKKAGTPSTA